MSETVWYKGRLTEIKPTQTRTIESIARTIFDERGLEFIGVPTYLEALCDELEDEYFFHGGKLYSMTKDEQEEYQDIIKAKTNKDGTIDYELKFYNGGTCFDECLDEALDELKTTPLIKGELEDFITSDGELDATELLIHLLNENLLEQTHIKKAFESIGLLYDESWNDYSEVQPPEGKYLTIRRFDMNGEISFSDPKVCDFFYSKERRSNEFALDENGEKQGFWTKWNSAEVVDYWKEIPANPKISIESQAQKEVNLFLPMMNGIQHYHPEKEGCYDTTAFENAKCCAIQKIEGQIESYKKAYDEVNERSMKTTFSSDLDVFFDLIDEIKKLKAPNDPS